MTTTKRPFVVVTEIVDYMYQETLLSPLGVEMATRPEEAYNNACRRWPNMSTFVVLWEDVPPKVRMVALLRDRGDIST